MKIETITLQYLAVTNPEYTMRNDLSSDHLVVKRETTQLKQASAQEVTIELTSASRNYITHMIERKLCAADC